MMSWEVLFYNGLTDATVESRTDDDYDNDGDNDDC